MKRSNDGQQPNEQDALDSNKRQRFTQSDYGDVYAQYGMMSQYAQANPFAQPTAQPGYAGYTQPMYSMYGAGQSMMASQYGGGYPQQFPTAAPTYSPTSQPLVGEATRTIYLGNVDQSMQPHEILSLVRTGMIESYRPCYEKTCAFLAFVDSTSAQAFFQEYLSKKLVIHNIEIKVGWGKPNTFSNLLRAQIQGGATRCVYLGRLTDVHTEEFISNAARKFGDIENVKIIADRNIAFVHFLSITSAVKCVASLAKEPEWTAVKVNYGKDHCAARNDFGQFGFQAFGQQQQQHMGYDAYGGYNPMPANPMVPSTNVLRTLYMGNIHPDTKTEDLCNAIRGGNLLQIRYLPDKHIAFVTFMDASTALTVYNHAQNVGLVIRGRKLRVGWGKPSTVSTLVSQAILQGATRNIYVGGIPETLTEDKLRLDFSAFGEIELVNTFREKKCAFVNFTSISNAVTAISAMRMNPEYSDFKLNYGKDRCGNAFKTMHRKNPVLDVAPAAVTEGALGDDEVKEDPSPSEENVEANNVEPKNVEAKVELKPE
ncbi:hypothetical protein BDF21DRAFT_467378 [Thamnidium elegans]|uniref:RRM domain-containing protein n=1 Tax=Thamnidium elegans TaxID=101142 RepID=A0A8H7VQD4_9FUNG|nr:hypothetical protein INT48_000013 [Thamnidium elegans]KAI8061397.1 hypothetical protein BDF21DRAFT_467378 [Thamnidium elegans]